MLNYILKMYVGSSGTKFICFYYFLALEDTVDIPIRCTCRILGRYLVDVISLKQFELCNSGKI